MNQTNKMNKMDKFYNFRNTNNDDIVELVIEGEIIASKGWVEEYFEDAWGEVSTGAKQFIEQLENYQDKNTIRVLINSPGGDVFAATSIYNHLKRTGKNIEVEITGYSCSAATIIMMAGNKISMPINSLVMIHDPLITLYGTFNSQDLEKKGKVLDKVKEIIINSYKSKVKIDDKRLSKLMSSETWMDAKECLEYGFIDEILHDKTVETIENTTSIFVNSIAYNKDKINNILNKNMENFKNFFKKQEKIEENIENNIEKEELSMDEKQEIAMKERERIKNIYKYKDKIDESLINEAIESGWEEKDLTFEAFNRNMIIKENTIFENHVKANAQSGVNNIEIDKSGEEATPSDPIQDLLNKSNKIQNIREI